MKPYLLLLSLFIFSCDNNINDFNNEECVAHYEAYADEHYDFLRWMEHYYDWQNDTIYNVLFQNQETEQYENIWDGSHYLNFTRSFEDTVFIMSTINPENPEDKPIFSDYYDYSGDGWFINEEVFNELLSDPNFSVIKDDNYYENIFKYNHFHAGWDDAAEIEFYESDGYLIAKSPNKWTYRELRDECLSSNIPWSPF